MYGPHSDLVLARFSELSYQNLESLPNTHILPHDDQCFAFQKIRTIEDVPTNTQLAMYRNANLSSVVIAFRGANEYADFRNLWANQPQPCTMNTKDCGKIPLGWQRTYHSVRDEILRSLLEEKESFDLYITGHSMGGALAALAGFDLATNPTLIAASSSTPGDLSSAPASASDNHPPHSHESVSITASPVPPSASPRLLRSIRVTTFGQPAVGDSFFQKSFRDLGSVAYTRFLIGHTRENGNQVVDVAEHYLQPGRSTENQQEIVSYVHVVEAERLKCVDCPEKMAGSDMTVADRIHDPSHYIASLNSRVEGGPISCGTINLR